MRLKEERDNVAKAKEALELAEPGKLYVICINNVVLSNTCDEDPDTASHTYQCWNGSVIFSRNVPCKL